MDLSQIISIFLPLFILYVQFWFLYDSINDWHRMDAKYKSYRTQSREEMKDFHEKLRLIRERRLQFEMGKR